MAHDASKVLLGSVGWSGAEVTCEPADPASFPAGLAVRRKSDGGLQLEDDSTARLVGVSLGADLSNAKRTAVCRSGIRIPLRLKAYAASKTIGDLIFTAKDAGAKGNQISITLADDESIDDGSAIVDIDDESPFDIVVKIEDSATTASTIKTAIDEDPKASALVSVEVDTGKESTAQAAAAKTDLEGGSDGAAVYGEAVYVNGDGEGCGENDLDAAATGATYASGPLTGYDPATETEHFVAYIHMPGGL